MYFFLYVLGAFIFFFQANAHNEKKNVPLKISIVQYLKNEEYFNTIASGKTLFGYNVKPILFFYPYADLQVAIGFVGQRFFGDKKKFHKILPLCTTQYNHQNFYLLFGHLPSYIFRSWISPLYDQEKCFTHFMEGIYFRTSSLSIFLNWIKYLNKKNKNPEKFVLGSKYKIPLYKNYPLQLTLPLQGYIYHVGGQNIQYKGYSLLIGALGKAWKYYIPNTLFNSISIKIFGIKNFFTTQAACTLKHGYGIYYNCKLKSIWGNFEAKYWYGNGFCSANIGENLYQSSILQQREDYFICKEKIRHLFFLSYKNKWQIKNNFSIHFTLLPYYDFINQILEHAAELYLCISI